MTFSALCVKKTCPAHGAQLCLQPKPGGDGKRRHPTALGLPPAFLTKVLLGKAEMGQFVPAAGERLAGLPRSRCRWDERSHGALAPPPSPALGEQAAAPGGRAEPSSSGGVPEGPWPPPCPGQRAPQQGLEARGSRSSPSTALHPALRPDRGFPEPALGHVSFQAGTKAEGPSRSPQQPVMEALLMTLLNDSVHFLPLKVLNIRACVIHYYYYYLIKDYLTHFHVSSNYKLKLFPL